MFIVRKQDLNPDGGASYLIEASSRYESKYRWGKTRKENARQFASKASARMWAMRLEGNAVMV